ncbi:hypothetical protein CANARDRAFT_178406 [[Candida] arabinofermentans NRRL YB-2248]|uniref:Uncharacterized protein n=1 Tax=[Candida] arabinofermentans NRRL YB-2248 TaxID=983967 RepID=A0A1E4SSR0_9ASCO|nr:hypothetical protein CANARDRAFT_178406 [[Candida] arabinofermentans NRRL YB-2248]
MLVISGVFVLSYKLEEEKQAAVSAMTTPLIPNELPLTPTNKKHYNDNLISIGSLTNSNDPQSPYYDRTLSTSPSIQAHHLNSKNDLISPIIKKTSEGFNNASRKVSGFFRKSIDTIQSTTSSNDSVVTPINKRKINHHTLSPIHSDQTSLIDNHNGGNDEITEYVSFGSLKDSSSFINNYDSTHNNNELSPTVSNNSNSGLGIFTPIINKINRQASTNTIGSVFQQQQQQQHQQIQPLQTDSNSNLNSNTNSRFSPFKSLKNYSQNQSTQSPTSMNYTQLSISPKSKPNRVGLSLLTSNLSTELTENKLDEDYNQNNSYNYSLNNTIEEIQNQLNSYDQNSQLNNDGDIISEHHQKHSIYNNNKSSKSKKAKRNLTSLIIDTNVNSNLNNRDQRDIIRDKVFPKRSISYEQYEILNELKNL